MISKADSAVPEPLLGDTDTDTGTNGDCAYFCGESEPSCNNEPCFEPCRNRKPVFLAAATGSAGPIPIIRTSILTNPIQIVSVALDPKKRCALSVLLDFTTMISLPLATDVKLSFQVLRTIDNATLIAISPQFTFARTVTVLESNFFGFRVFDRNIEGDAITYSVVLAGIATHHAQFADGVPEDIVSPTVTILNSALSALGV